MIRACVWKALVHCRTAPTVRLFDNSCSTMLARNVNHAMTATCAWQNIGCLQARAQKRQRRHCQRRQPWWHRRAWGPGKPPLGQPSGHLVAEFSSVYSCSIPHHGSYLAALSITAAHAALRAGHSGLTHTSPGHSSQLTSRPMCINNALLASTSRTRRRGVRHGAQRWTHPSPDRTA